MFGRPPGTSLSCCLMVSTNKDDNSPAGELLKGQTSPGMGKVQLEGHVSPINSPSLAKFNLNVAVSPQCLQSHLNKELFNNPSDHTAWYYRVLGGSEWSFGLR